MSLLRSLINKLTYFFAICIILAGAILVSLQQLTPWLTEHKLEFENYASQLLHVPVKINEVKLAWFRHQPVLELNQVSLLNNKTHQSVLKFNQIKILFSLSSSLWQRQVVPSGVLLSGADLSIEHSETGYHIQALSALNFNSPSSSPDATRSEVMNKLMQIPRLFLHDIQLQVMDERQGVHHIQLRDLSFQNTENTHKLTGQAILQQTVPTKFSVAISWKGKEWNPSQFRGKAYFEFSKLSLPQWLKEFGLEQWALEKWDIKNWQIRQGMANAKVWLTLHEGKVTAAKTDMQLDRFKLYSNTSQITHAFSHLSGSFSWAEKGQQHLISGNDILINMKHVTWPLTHFSVTLNNENNKTTVENVNTGYVDLKTAREFMLSSANVLPEKLNSFLKESALSGSIQNVVVSFDPHHETLPNVALEFTNLTIPKYLDYPGIEHLSGTFNFNVNQGKLILKSKDVVFNDPKIFANKLYFAQLNGEFDVSQSNEKNWLVQTPSLLLKNADLEVHAALQINVKKDLTVYTKTQADFSLFQAKNISDYLPLATFDKGLSKWLREAFISGAVTEGRAVLRGNLHDFPFDQNNGEFNIEGKLNQVNLRFAPNWPMLEKIKGAIAFSGRQIYINIDQTQTKAILTNKVYGQITLGHHNQPSTLTVTTAPIQINLRNAHDYVEHSPLEKSIGAALKKAVLNGNAKFALNLKIPLMEPDKTEVLGYLDFRDANMQSPSYHLNLTDITGKVQFTESSIEAKKISSKLFNRPFEFGLRTLLKENKEHTIQVFFKNTLSIDDIATWLKLPKYKDSINGSAMVAGTINFNHDTTEIKLNSDLQGVAITLPGFYKKEADKQEALNTTLLVDGNNPLKIDLDYNKAFYAGLLIEKEKENYQLKAANISFGKMYTDAPTSGLVIEGQFEHLDWDNLKASLGKSTTSDLSLPIKKVDVSIKQFKLFNQNLSKVEAEVLPDENNWQVYVKSDQVIGSLSIPKEFNRNDTLSADFTKLALTTGSDVQNEDPGQSIVKTLPNLSLVAHNVLINNIYLGEINVKATTIDDGLKIQRFQINSKKIALNAIGEWTSLGNNDSTHLRGNASSRDVSSLLNSLGLHAANLDAKKGNMNYNIVMPGNIYSPAVKKMKGYVSLTLGPGHIVDVGKQSGAKMDLARMLSVFSLQTLPRRLSLDFSDVFQKGYAFDKVQGNFVLDTGDIYTKHFYFDGPIARISLNGRIGVNDKDYDLTLTVTPHVTSTIPVAATLLGGPLVGAGALVVNAVLGPQFSKVTEMSYTISGPWQDPIWIAKGK